MVWYMRDKFVNNPFRADSRFILCNIVIVSECTGYYIQIFKDINLIFTSGSGVPKFYLNAWARLSWPTAQAMATTNQPTLNRLAQPVSYQLQRNDESATSTCMMTFQWLFNHYEIISARRPFTATPRVTANWTPIWPQPMSNIQELCSRSFISKWTKSDHQHHHIHLQQQHLHTY